MGVVFWIKAVIAGFLLWLTIRTFERCLGRIPESRPPLKEGARYRLSVKVGEIKDLPQGAEGLMLATIEVEGESKPACAAEVVYRFIGA